MVNFVNYNVQKVGHFTQSKPWPNFWLPLNKEIQICINNTICSIPNCIKNDSKQKVFKSEKEGSPLITRYVEISTNQYQGYAKHMYHIYKRFN
jgi:hypothetical protein